MPTEINLDVLLVERIAWLLCVYQLCAKVLTACLLVLVLLLGQLLHKDDIHITQQVPVFQ